MPATSRRSPPPSATAPTSRCIESRRRVFSTLERGDYHAALKEIEGGVSEIEAFYQDYSQDDIAPLSGEIKFLQGWADEIRRNIPPSPRERLERELEEAIETEDYERAAEINELIKRLAH